MLQVVIKKVQPKFKVTWSERRICPICGREFKAKINTWRADPTHAHYCSKQCRMKANDRTLAHRVSNEEFKEEMIRCKEVLHSAALFQTALSTHDNSLGYQDVMQECLITLWLMMCRERRAGRVTRLHHNGYLFNILRKSMKHSKAWIKRNMHDEEETLELYHREGLANLVPDSYDLDTVLDIRTILNEVYNLAKENRNVALALEKAVSYRIFQDRIMGEKMRRKHNLTHTQFFDAVTKGVEYIFYMMPDQIKLYIDVARTNETYRFHPNHDWKRLKRRDVSQMTKEELSRYFATDRQCCICGKWFTPTAAQRGKDRVACSKECVRKLNNLRCKEYRLRKEAKEQECK